MWLPIQLNGSAANQHMCDVITGKVVYLRYQRYTIQAFHGLPMMPFSSVYMTKNRMRRVFLGRNMSSVSSSVTDNRPYALYTVNSGAMLWR